MVHLQRAPAGHHQRSLSFMGLVVIGAALVAALAIGGQSLPVFLEYQAVRKGGFVQGMRTHFGRAAQMDGLQSICGRDLESSQRNAPMLLSCPNSRKTPLAGPAYLVYRFNDQIP